jgi:hypothetical protein
MSGLNSATSRVAVCSSQERRVWQPVATEISVRRVRFDDGYPSQLYVPVIPSRLTCNLTLSLSKHQTTLCLL